MPHPMRSDIVGLWYVCMGVQTLNSVFFHLRNTLPC